MPASPEPEAIAPPAEDQVAPAGLRKTAIQRLQVGLSLLGGIILLVALANVIQDRAKQSDYTAVPQAASTVAPEPTATQANPLADAGVVPDLPAEPVSPSPGATLRPRAPDGATPQ